MPHTAALRPRAHSAHAPLLRLSAVALSAYAERELLEAFEEEARSALAADAVEVIATRAETSGLTATSEPTTPPAGIAQVAAGARTVALDEIQAATELGAELGERLQARGALLVPLGWAGDVRHVAVLATIAPREWARDDIVIAETLANQAALGLARLEAEHRRVAQADRDRALARAARALNVSLELDTVLDTLAREAGVAVAGEIAGVYLLDEDGCAVATAGHNCPEEWFGFRLEPGEGLAGRVLATGRAVTTSSSEIDIPSPSGFLGDRARSGVGVPMRWSGKLRGVLAVGFDELRRVGPDELQALEAFADLAVVACQNAETYDHARTAASTDALTGLFNHGAMQVRVREEIARAAREGLPLSCVLIDLDDFKRVNDELGHPAGDALLRGVAASLRAEMRSYDQAARYGGDEFVLVLPGTTEQEARVVAERVRDRVRAGTPGAESDPLGSCCSIGVAAWTPPQTAAELLAAADRALLLAKRTGKGRVAVASSDAEEELERLEQSDASPAAVHALATAIEARDNYATGHSDQVVRLATGVALLLGLTADAVERVGHGALLHDVGKLGISNDILHKDGTLDDAEWSVMAQHPVIGEGILRRIPQLAPLAPIVRHEHEHWDGTGYPDGLAGTQIPIGSRIILACDAYAAMINARPYRPALTPDEAVAELRARAGTQFDPQVVEALLDLLRA